MTLRTQYREKKNQSVSNPPPGTANGTAIKPVATQQKCLRSVFIVSTSIEVCPQHIVSVAGQMT